MHIRGRCFSLFMLLLLAFLALFHLLHRIQVSFAHMGDVFVRELRIAIFSHLCLNVGSASEKVGRGLRRISLSRVGVAGRDEGGLMRRQL